VVIVPVLRSSVLERLGPAVLGSPGTQLLLARRRATDLDVGLLGPWAGRLIERRWLGLAVAVRCARPQVLEVPEPMWFRAWLPTALLLLGLRATGLRPSVVTYAIENLAPAESLSTRRAGVPGVLARLVDPGLRALWRVSTRLVDEVAFGTPAARRTWLEALPRSRSGRVGPVVTESLGPCQHCAPLPRPDREVLFVSELSERKGVPDLLTAWPWVAEQRPGWRLVLMGQGPQRSAAGALADQRDDVRLLPAASREEVHAALRRASIVVLPSRRVPGWREQVGLPILEGLAHGCLIVATTESGLADSLTAGGHIVVQPGDPASLRDGLLLATSMPPPAPAPGGRDSRRQVEAWFQRRS